MDVKQITYILQEDGCTFSAAVSKIADAFNAKDREIVRLNSEVEMLQRHLNLYHEAEFV